MKGADGRMDCGRKTKEHRKDRKNRIVRGSEKLIAAPPSFLPPVPPIILTPLEPAPKVRVS